MGILITILILGVVIAIHEYGHYVAMRRNGIEVEDFSIGFGKSLWKRKLKSGAMFNLRLIPFGGFVKPVHEKGEGSVEAARPWVRCKIYLAGMFFNSIAAFLVLLVIGYATGMIPGVLFPYVKWAPGWLLPLVVAILGSFGFWLITPPLIVYMIFTMGTGFIEQSAGPVGIVTMGSQIAEQSLTFGQYVLKYAFFFYVINVAVAGFNLMPLFPLDGGHIAKLLVEKVAGKRKEAAGKWFMYGSLAVFLLLVVVVLGYDIIRPFIGGTLPQL